MKAVKILTVICAVLVFVNFTVSQSSGQETGKVPTTAVDSGSNNINSQVVAKRNEKYRIGFQDTLEIQVFRHPELAPVPINVNPDGTIRLPNINNPIVAVCKTERELADTITALYKSYLKNPFVNVRAIEQRSQPFAVIGAVEKPGSLYLNRKIRLLELLAFAGGPKVEKAGSKIQVARVGNVSGCIENNEDAEKEVVFLAFKTNDVMSGKENPLMEPGDIVSVLEAEQAYVVGNVKKPTTISLKEPVTLTQAVAIAEGFDKTANTTKIVVQRQATSTQGKTEIVYSLKDIREKKIPDPYLQANDIVEVLTDNNKVVKNGFFNLLKTLAPTGLLAL